MKSRKGSSTIEITLWVVILGISILKFLSLLKQQELTHQIRSSGLKKVIDIGQDERQPFCCFSQT